jgi:serine/threonine protein kinase/Tfp pilus assembly protein PilF
VVGNTIQHYAVRSRLGKGGMGEVYLAEDTRLGREVALKMLPSDSQTDPERRARLLTEARAASALRSSNIAAIYDIGEEDGLAFLVMEYVEGEPLSERLMRGALPVREALDVAIQVADALDEAHGRGIVHRDIKSANIMLTRRGLVKVLDFGLAKFIQGTDGRASIDSALTMERTVAGMVLGTISYMSPEQALGKSVDGRSDLFSLGVVLYESVAAHLPFAGTSFAAVVNAILNQPPVPLGQYLDTTPQDLDAIVQRALEKKPELRYQTAREFQTDLNSLRDTLDGHQRMLSSGIRARELSGGHNTAEMSNSIAVMTFINITREPADEWIGSGIAETVGADLRNVPGVSVIGRERIFDALRNLQSADAAAMDDRFAIEIGRGLGARWIVSGGYQRAGSQLRITAHIVEVATGVTLRTVKIDGAIADIFSLQDRIVFELTQGLDLQLAGSAIAEIQRVETRSVDAYELYSRATMTMRLASRDAPDRAISLFEKALAIDPEYAEAWAGLGGAYQIKGSFLNLPELLEKAVEFERRALALDPMLAEAHTWLGATLLALGRVEQSIEALQQAVKLDPKQPRPWAMLARAYWIGRGDITHGIAKLEHAVSLNPQFGYGHLQLAFLYTEIGKFDKAQAAAERAVDLQERYISGEEGLLIVGAHTRLGYVHYRQGRYPEAIAQYQAELLFLTAIDHVLKERALIELHQKMGAAYLKLGQRPDAERHLKTAIRSFEDRLASGTDDAPTKYYAAVAYALSGDLKHAVKYLEQTFTKLGALNRKRIMHDPDLEGVRELLPAETVTS